MCNLLLGNKPEDMSQTSGAIILFLFFLSTPQSGYLDYSLEPQPVLGTHFLQLARSKHFPYTTLLTSHVNGFANYFSLPLKPANALYIF